MPGTRRPDLDGLRGLAVLSVVGFHAGVPALRGAFVAVDVFFVLSGFFLATSLTQRIATGEEIRPLDVFSRRLWRLLPLATLVLLGTLATTLLYAPIDRAAVAHHLLPVSAFVGNLTFAAGGVNYFRAGENPLLHTWTLGVELQLALLLPALVMLLAALGERRASAATRAAEAPGSPGPSNEERRLVIVRTVMFGLVLVAALSFSLAVVINDTAPMWAYFGPHTRLWAFCAGALVAFVSGGGQSAVGDAPQRLAWTGFLGLGLILAPVVLYDGSLAYPGVIALAPVGGTMLLLAGGAAAAKSAPGRLLAWSPLVALGGVAFAWYLWHWPLIVLGGVLIPGIGVAGKLAFGFAGLLAALLTLRLLARPRPTQVVTRLATDRPILAAVALCAVTAMLAIAVERRAEEYVAGSVHSRYAAAREDDVDHGCWDRPATIGLRHGPRAGCAFGDATSGTTLALIGDSHASHWLGGLERAGMEQGWRVEVFVKGACPVADLRGLLHGAAQRLYKDCATFQEAVWRRLAAERPHAVLLSNSDNYLRARDGLMHVPALEESVWEEGLRRSYARFARLGIRVIVMRGLPWVPFDVPSCLSRREEGLPFASDCRFARDRAFMVRARAVQERAARGLHVRFVDLNDLVCPRGPGECATERDGMILYSDDNHITSTFSRSLGGELGARVAAALEPSTRR
jgi:peptidoglycan/LPS O-acetylase OafA/YrhL